MCLEEFSIARECRIMKPRALDLLLPSRRMAAEKKRRLQRHRGAECRFFALSYLRITRQYGAERIAIHQRLWCPDARKTSKCGPRHGSCRAGTATAVRFFPNQCLGFAPTCPDQFRGRQSDAHLYRGRPRLSRSDSGSSVWPLIIGTRREMGTRLALTALRAPIRRDDYCSAASIIQIVMRRSDGISIAGNLPDMVWSDPWVGAQSLDNSRRRVFQEDAQTRGDLSQ